MKKTIFLAFLCIFVLFLIAGCSADEKEAALPPVPEIPEDYVYLASENIYYEYESWEDGMVYIPLITAFPLEEEDVAISLGDGLPAVEYSFGQVYMDDYVAVTMPFYVYQIYRGKDWAAYAAQTQEFYTLLEQGGDVTEADAKREEMQNEYLDDYLALQEAGKLPVLYNYQVRVFLPTDAAISELHEIILYIKGEAHPFPVGRIHCDANSELPDSGEALIPRSLIAGWHVQSASRDGCFYENREQMLCIEKATEDLSISDIYLWEDEREISDIEILITEPANPEIPITIDTYGQQENAAVIADYRWDGKSPISLKKDELLCVRFTFHDPNLENQLTGYTQYYVAVEYQTDDGNSYTYLLWYPMAVSPVSFDPHEIYLAHELGIDVLSYYEEYYLAE